MGHATEGSSKKLRKPYTITNHAQKYFLKVQKNGILALVPPPRPKRKAAHPYIQKAPGHVTLDESFVYPPSSSCLIPAYNMWADASIAANYPLNEALPSLEYVAHPPTVEGMNKTLYILSETSVVFFLFIAGLVDPDVKWTLGVYLQKLKQMDPIIVKSILVLVRNLTNNLTSPEFELHKRTLSIYDANTKTTSVITGTPLPLTANQVQHLMEADYVGLLPPF
ncbi:hypothetical protein J5N97_013674 [Dioscorea zingiberensis]|uniref:Uncharacterized protein n=1 Tax=Dioscorea zingiberensis TaxID=325984 RepID=A0A9D5CR08_9LILI|nr:hypothetical protein J5N97_013674 [Dioscorea zingiberensis]